MEKQCAAGEREKARAVQRGSLDGGVKANIPGCNRPALGPHVTMSRLSFFCT